MIKACIDYIPTNTINVVRVNASKIKVIYCIRRIRFHPILKHPQINKTSAALSFLS